MNNPWTQQQRELLDQILDQVIPANPQKGIPSAGSFGVGDFIASRALEDDAVLTALHELLSSAESTGKTINVNTVRQLESSYAASFSTLLRLAYMGYYSRPQIRSLLGLGSWAVHPKGYDVPVEPSDLLETLTAPVKERGPVYRDPDDQSQVPS